MGFLVNGLKNRPGHDARQRRAVAASLHLSLKADGDPRVPRARASRGSPTQEEPGWACPGPSSQTEVGRPWRWGPGPVGGGAVTCCGLPASRAHGWCFVSGALVSGCRCPRGLNLCLRLREGRDALWTGRRSQAVPRPCPGLGVSGREEPLGRRWGRLGGPRGRGGVSLRCCGRLPCPMLVLSPT